MLGTERMKVEEWMKWRGRVEVTVPRLVIVMLCFARSQGRPCAALSLLAF